MPVEEKSVLVYRNHEIAGRPPNVPRNQDEENANQCGIMLVSHRKRVYAVCDLFDTEIFAYFLPFAHA